MTSAAVNGERVLLTDRHSDTRMRSLFFAVVSVMAYTLIGFVAGLSVDLVVAAGYALLRLDDSLTSITTTFLIWFPVVVGAVFLLVFAVLQARAWLRGDELLLYLAGARPRAHPLSTELDNIAAELSLAIGMPAPSVWIIRDDGVNSLSVGKDRRRATVAVTSGLLETLTRAEVEMVLAHELAHATAGDERFRTLLVANQRLYLATRRRLDEASRQPEDGYWTGVLEGRSWIDVYLRLVASIQASIVGWALGYGLRALRERDAAADDLAVLIGRDPAALISALRKAHAAKVQVTVPDLLDLAPIWFVEPALPKGDALPLQVQAPLDERIRRIEQAGVRENIPPRPRDPLAVPFWSHEGLAARRARMHLDIVPGIELLDEEF